VSANWWVMERKSLHEDPWSPAKGGRQRRRNKRGFGIAIEVIIKGRTGSFNCLKTEWSDLDCRRLPSGLFERTVTPTKKEPRRVGLDGCLV